MSVAEHESSDPNTRKLTGRDQAGRFGPGNTAAAGAGGGARDLARWRRVALEATTDQDMLDIWAALITSAKSSEPWAVHEFLDRTMGKAIPAPPEAQQDVSALMARLWQEWAAPRPGAGPVEDAQFTEKPDKPAPPEGVG
jgi:hypothetical protein